MDISEEDSYSESESGSQFFDDSQSDPDFEMEETRLSFSNLSLKRESKRSNIIDVVELDYEEEAEELDEKDKKSYEIIQKMIEGGEVNKLKVDECKIYLRKHGLRLSGKKDILIQRIMEHVDIINGGGEQKYPASSFVLNCKGDACKGDVVIFEQNVYEEFSIVSRCSNGGPCGTRIVAGRILKESYGAAKQQHTFTIEVLWSKGEKPLPPLHPLLIKGRNLYRMNTMRQKWEDEGERQRILSEKHARGGAARSNREARIQQKEMRKTLRPTRATGNKHPKKNQENEKRKPLIHHPQHQHHAGYNRAQESNIPIQPENLYGNPNHRQNVLAPLPLHHPQQHQQQHYAVHCRTQESNIPIQPGNLHGNPNYRQNVLAPQPLHLRPPVMATNCNFQRVPHQQSRVHHMQNTNAVGNRPTHQQQCRYFGQGRCHFGDRCKFYHELASNK